MCKLEAGPPEAPAPPGTSGGKPFRPPLPLSEGSKLRRAGLGWEGGAELAAPHPAVPLSVQCRQCIEPSRADGQGQGDCAFRTDKGQHLQDGEHVLLTEVAPGLFTGF